ncbi:hypothetical protein DFJ74DRAFT_774518 [Hyaloraphidium curvatum]|nr:hypothetical protein DFJ74DRAFT_774518 [Hyaloraphidium curvatum]
MKITDLPDDVLRDLCNTLGIVNLVAIVRLSATCRSLRAAIGAIAPWQHTLLDLAAAPIDDSTEGPKAKRPENTVDPKDLVRKRGAMDWWKPLAKYGARLCLACCNLHRRADVLRVDAPATLVDLMAWEIQEGEDVYPIGIWDEANEADDDDADHAEDDEDWDLVQSARTSLCASCRQDLWTLALILARDEPRDVPDCADALDRKAGLWVNKKDGERRYHLRGLMGNIPHAEVVIATRYRWRGSSDIIEYRYDLDRVLMRAWETHGGPWGLQAIQDRDREKRKLREKKRKEKEKP